MSDRTTGLKGTPFKLDGPELKPGDKAPDFLLPTPEGDQVFAA